MSGNAGARALVWAEMGVDKEILELVSEAVAEADAWEAVAAGLRPHDPEDKDVRLRPFVVAYSFRLRERYGASGERPDGPFVSMMSGPGWQFPPPLEEIAEEDVEAWTQALEEIEHPVARARLGDLLWERKAPPNPGRSAGLACDALSEVAANRGWRMMDRVHALARALELARGIRDSTRTQRIVGALIALIETDLGSEAGGVGISLGAARPIVELPAGERPAELDALLERVGESYAAVTVSVDAVADLRIRLADADASKALRVEQVQRWRDEAAREEGMLRVHWLEHALEIARSNGLREQAQELRRELGEITPDQLGLQSITAEVEIPQEELERFLTSFQELADWRQALALLAAQGPPGGQPAELEEQIDQLMAEFPVQFLFGKSLIGPDNATSIFRAGDAVTHRRLVLAEERARAARLWGVLCARALERIGARSDRPDRGALAGFFANEFIDAELAERIARAVELYWDGQPDECAHVLVPRLEAVLREMARQVGIPVVREPLPGREIGGVEMLGSVLRDLHGAFADPGWHAYLLNLLADPLGLNLRNSIGHGLHGTVGEVDAALLVQAAALLAGMSARSVADPAEPPPGAAVAAEG